jgi:hypothetical protein
MFYYTKGISLFEPTSGSAQLYEITKLKGPSSVSVADAIPARLVKGPLREVKENHDIKAMRQQDGVVDAFVVSPASRLNFFWFRIVSERCRGGRKRSKV